jgi:hypothetical protein
MENVLGYSAWRAGLSVAPRGIGVVVALLTVGQLSRRQIDMRRIVGCGFLLAGWAAWHMSQWPIDASQRQVLLPIFLFGLGLGSVFPTLTALGLGQIQRERIGFAASLFGMIINSGAATGIAIVSNALTSRHSFHLTQMTTYFGFLDAYREAGFIHAIPFVVPSPGYVADQAWLFSYHDVYRVLAVLVASLGPWCLLLKPARARANAEVVFE